MSFPHSHQVVLVSSRFRYPGQWLLFPKARLFLDRLELSGWRLQKKHRHEIPLDQVTRADWHMDDDTAYDVVLHLASGETVCLSLPHADEWKRSLEARLRWTLADPDTVSSTLPRQDMPLDELIMYTTTLG